MWNHVISKLAYAWGSHQVHVLNMTMNAS